MRTVQSLTTAQTGGMDSVVVMKTLRSLLSDLILPQVRTPRVLELGTAESKPLVAELAREMPIEPINDKSMGKPDVVIIHP